MHSDQAGAAAPARRPRPGGALTRLRRQLVHAREWVLLSQTDVVIATYPKTGSTWLQLLLRKLFVDHFQLGDEAIGRVVVNSLRALRRRPRGVPRIYITHGMPGFNDEPYHTMSMENRRFRRHKVILLTREPKDTLVSLYFHNRYRTVPAAYGGDIEQMVRDDVYGIDKYIRYYQEWHRDRGAVRDFLLVRYEDLRRDPGGTLQTICAFIGLTGVTDETIAGAVAFCSFENMQKAEAADSRHLPGLNRSKNQSAEAFKVRQGRVGGYRDHLSEGTARYIDACVAERLPSEYGYPLDRA